MGEVWKARDTRLERTVAIKVLPEHLSEDVEVRHPRQQADGRAGLASPDFHAGSPIALFSVSIPSFFLAEPYDVNSDGTKFLVNSAGSDQGSPPLSLLSNWTSLLGKPE